MKLMQFFVNFFIFAPNMTIVQNDIYSSYILAMTLHENKLELPIPQYLGFNAMWIFYKNQNELIGKYNVVRKHNLPVL